jgi:hypothetical protein
MQEFATSPQPKGRTLASTSSENRSFAGQDCWLCRRTVQNVVQNYVPNALKVNGGWEACVGPFKITLKFNFRRAYAGAGNHQSGARGCP